MTMAARITDTLCRGGRRSGDRFFGITIVMALVAALAMSTPARAQADDPAEALEDFVHYTLIANASMAAGWGQKILESGITDAELAEMVDKTSASAKRFDSAIGRALLVIELEDIAAEVARRVEVGRRDLARDPDRIDKSIAMLVGTQRQRLLATGRLMAAGEFAVPALVKEITDGRQERLKLASLEMLREIGLASVTPLSVSLSEIDPRSAQLLCGALGDIGYPHAAPYLMTLIEDPTTDGPVRESAQRALSKLDVLEGVSRSQLYTMLAHQYFDLHTALTPFPYEVTNNVWSFDPFVGLVGTPVPTAIFNEVMAMGLTATALEIDPTNLDALSLYVAANLKRENDMPRGADDPIYGEGTYSPSFFATVFGADVCLDVLKLALDTNDTPLVRDAIAALSQTTGGSNLFGGVQGGNDGRRPLLEALAYPDRRVQYETALTLAHALPDEGFEGDFRVVPILASAVRIGDQAFAVVIVADDENRRQAAITLEKLGYTLVGEGANVPEVAGMVAEAPGIDLVLVRMDSPEDTREALAGLRSMTQTVAVPVITLVSGADEPVLSREYAGDPRVKTATPRIGEPAFAAAVADLLNRAVGGRISESEADAYAFDALAALEDVAISCTRAYAVSDAESALLDALDTRSGRARLLVAAILSRIATDESQRRLMDAALASGEGEQVDLLDEVSASVKRFGGRLDRRQTLGLLDLIANSDGATAEAAARLHGSLNLPSDGAIMLIQPTAGDSAMK